MAENLAAEAATLWGNVETVARAVALGEIKRALANLRPGGAHVLEMIVVSPTASLLVDAGDIDVLYPCVITSVRLRAGMGETASAVVDLKVARPGQEPSEGLSICGANLPALSAAEQVIVEPVADWTTYLEAGSLLLPYIHSVSGATRLTIAVRVRCL